MSNTRTRYTAEYLYPGAFFPEETVREIPEPTFAAAVEHGPDDTDGYFRKDGWYAVHVRSIPEKLYRSDDGQEQWLRDGDPIRRSFIVGRLVHYESPELDGERHDILRSNIRCNSRDPLKGYGVLTRSGNWQIASDYDEVVSDAAVTR